MMEFTVVGRLYSMKNKRRLIYDSQSRPRFVKSEDALQYEHEALWQLKALMRGRKPFTVPVVVSMDIYYPNHRQDLDPSLLLDIMQQKRDPHTKQILWSGVYVNDRLVEELHLRRFIDKDNPRAVVRIEER